MSGRSALVRKKGGRNTSGIRAADAIRPQNQTNGTRNIGHAQSGAGEDGVERGPWPAMRAGDVCGIEKSSLRSMLDKGSEGVRKGIAKTFGYGKKREKKPDEEARLESTAAARAEESVKDLQAQLPQARLFECGIFASPPPSTELPPLPTTATTLMRWLGSGRPVQRWNKLRKDPELWDLNGDVLVFLSAKGQNPRPNASFRLSSHTVERAGSAYLTDLLRQILAADDANGTPSSPGVSQRHQSFAAQFDTTLPAAVGRFGHPSPAASEDTDWAGQRLYEMYFPTPPNMTEAEALRYSTTTRNVFALLCNASLVGMSLQQALSDLQARLSLYMTPNADNTRAIVDYLRARAIDDVRNDPETAVSLLAWAEHADVRWEDGWRESFLHCAGMYTRLDACADFKNTKAVTRSLLERASLETALRVQAAEERLADFGYADMWHRSWHVSTVSSARGAAERLRVFFLQYYARQYGGKWPPSPESRARPGALDLDDDLWLTRTLAQQLQEDFGALYDCLVDRDVVWDCLEARSGRKWLMVSKSMGSLEHADSSDLPLTDLLVEFDNKLRVPHMPHPFPMLPGSISPRNQATDSSSRTKSTGQNSAAGRRTRLAYIEATNMCSLGTETPHSNLVEAFGKFEKADHVGEVDPRTARRGRWILIYGILQTLAKVSVDAPGARYRENVAYHLSPRLKGAMLPPWRRGPSGPSCGANVVSGSWESQNPNEASHERSYCWLAPQRWSTASAVNSGAEDESRDSRPTPAHDTRWSERAAPSKTYHSQGIDPAPMRGWIYRSASIAGGSGGLVSSTDCMISDSNKTNSSLQPSISFPVNANTCLRVNAANLRWAEVLGSRPALADSWPLVRGEPARRVGHDHNAWGGVLRGGASIAAAGDETVPSPRALQMTISTRFDKALKNEPSSSSGRDEGVCWIRDFDDLDVIDD